MSSDSLFITFGFIGRELKALLLTFPIFLYFILFYFIYSFLHGLKSIEAHCNTVYTTVYILISLGCTHQNWRWNIILWIIIIIWIMWLGFFWFELVFCFCFVFWRGGVDWLLISFLLCYLIFLVVKDKLFWHFLLILHSPPPPPSLFVILLGATG